MIIYATLTYQQISKNIYVPPKRKTNPFTYTVFAVNLKIFLQKLLLQQYFFTSN